jgi:hypothetical protein
MGPSWEHVGGGGVQVVKLFTSRAPLWGKSGAQRRKERKLYG